MRLAGIAWRWYQIPDRGGKSALTNLLCTGQIIRRSKRLLVSSGSKPGQSHEGKLEAISRAFSPFLLLLVSATQADGLGWYIGAPLALSFAGAIGTLPARLAVRLGAGRFMRLPWDRNTRPYFAAVRRFMLTLMLSPRTKNAST